MSYKNTPAYLTLPFFKSAVGFPELLAISCRRVNFPEVFAVRFNNWNFFDEIA